jgi:hypothetical protein
VEAVHSAACTGRAGSMRGTTGTAVGGGPNGGEGAAATLTGGCSTNALVATGGTGPACVTGSASAGTSPAQRPAGRLPGRAAPR